MLPCCQGLEDDLNVKLSPFAERKLVRMVKNYPGITEVQVCCKLEVAKTLGVKRTTTFIMGFPADNGENIEMGGHYIMLLSCSY